MKSKPRPSKELIVLKYTKHIHLIYHSRDAEVFIATEAPNYGFVRKLDNLYSLEIQAGYDLNEVAEYFESYNDD